MKPYPFPYLFKPFKTYSNLSNPSSNLSKPIQTYPNLSKPIQTYSKQSKTIQNYPNLSHLSLPSLGRYCHSLAYRIYTIQNKYQLYQTLHNFQPLLNHTTLINYDISIYKNPIETFLDISKTLLTYQILPNPNQTYQNLINPTQTCFTYPFLNPFLKEML